MLDRIYRWIVPDNVDVMGTTWRTMTQLGILRWETNGMNVVAYEPADTNSIWTDSRQGGERGAESALVGG